MKCSMTGTQQAQRPMTIGEIMREAGEGPILKLYRDWRQIMSSSSTLLISSEPMLLSLCYQQGKVDILSWDGHSVQVRGGISF